MARTAALSPLKNEKLAGVDNPGSIQQLKLQVTSHSGSGVLSKADWINRLYTSGGVGPTGACTAAATVPYKAVYVFWDDPAIS